GLDESRVQDTKARGMPRSVDAFELAEKFVDAPLRQFQGDVSQERGIATCQLAPANAAAAVVLRQFGAEKLRADGIKDQSCFDLSAKVVETGRDMTEDR